MNLLRTSPTATPADMDPLLTLTQLAQLAQLSRRSIDRLVEAGELKTIRFNRSVRIEHAEARRFLSAGVGAAAK